MAEVEKKSRRVRRTPEEAKSLILDAAEEQMIRSGPAGIRLQDLGKQVGIAHSTILHHFSSREALVEALNRRTVERLGEAVLAEWARGEDQGRDVVSVIFRTFRGGLAQRLAWLIQMEGDEPGEITSTMFRDLTEALHRTRLATAKPGDHVDKGDSLAVSHLVTVAAFGDAFLGARLRTAAPELTTAEGFEVWFANMLDRHFSKHEQ